MFPYSFNLIFFGQWPGDRDFPGLPFRRKRNLYDTGLHGLDIAGVRNISNNQAVSGLFCKKL